MDELQKARPKLKDIQILPGDLEAILEMSINSVKLGRPAKFSETRQGLEDFKQSSIDYLEYVREINNNPDNEHHLIPDIESWATYLGTTRATILVYEKQRSDEWKEFIQLMKGAITAAKKQLAFRQRIPTVLAIFDLVSNSGYINASEFKLSPILEQPEKRALSAAELPKLGEFKQMQSEDLTRIGAIKECEVKEND